VCGVSGAGVISPQAGDFSGSIPVSAIASTLVFSELTGSSRGFFRAHWIWSCAYMKSGFVKK